MYVAAAETCKFPIILMETDVLLVVCRVAVSMSRVVQWSSHRAP